MRAAAEPIPPRALEGAPGASRTSAPMGPASRLWGLGLALLVVLLLYPFVPGLLGAAVLYVLTAPLLRGLGAAGPRRLAAFVLMFLCFFAVFVPGAWLVAELLGQLPDALRQLQGSAAFTRLMAVRVGDIELGALLRQATTEIVAWSSSRTITALSGALHSVLNLVVALFGAYYLLTASEAVWPRLRLRLPMEPAAADVLRTRFHRVTEAMVLGVVLASLAQGIMVGVAFHALGLPNALVWGGVTAVVSLLPVFGSALVWLPASLVLLASHRPGAAVFLALYGGLLVSNVDNVLRLVVYKRVSQIHPMLTLVGAFAGVKVFGIAGLLLGPLVLSYALELLTLSVPRNAAAA